MHYLSLPDVSESAERDGSSFTVYNGPAYVSELILPMGVPGGTTAEPLGAAEVESSSAAYQAFRNTQRLPRECSQHPTGLGLSVLFCDLCKDETASVLSLVDRKVLCVNCDTLMNSGKSESVAPRFRLEAKCLPRVLPRCEGTVHTTKCMEPVIGPQGSITNEELTDSQLLIANNANSSVAEQLLDLDSWPGVDYTSLSLKFGHHSGNQIVSAAHSGESGSLEAQDSIFSMGQEVNNPKSPVSFQSADSMESGFGINQAMGGIIPSRKRISSTGSSTCKFQIKSGAISKRTSTAGCLSPRSGKGHGDDCKQCVHCGVTKTPQWRAGPLGQKTLCNACGVRYKAGRLAPVVAYPPPGYSGLVSPPPPPSGRAAKNQTSW